MPFPLQGSLYSPGGPTRVILALKMCREFDPTEPAVPVNLVWALIVDNWEIAIQSLDHFITMRQP